MSQRDRILGSFFGLFCLPNKAAPRFELGIKDLQSSALPLGHAAVKEVLSSSLADSISPCTHALLILSNGHGEDVISLRVLEVLHQLKPSLALEVLPLVGEGKAFNKGIAEGWIRRRGPSILLPSGGFSNQSIPGFFGDLLAGLIQVTWVQWRTVRSAVNHGRVILAVGDSFPLFLAWLSGAKYGFIGTPKSDYTWMSGPGFSLSDLFHALKGSEWDPWEFALMSSLRCQMVAVRDPLTARGLRKHGVLAKAPGNPMMDGIESTPLPNSIKSFRRVLLLCGSRNPEAKKNFYHLMQASELVEISDPLLLMAPLGSEPFVHEIEEILQELGYKKAFITDELINSQTCWVKGSRKVVVGPGQFFRWVSWAEVGLANAGTATEQLVGLGIPAISLPGNGPQFKRSFAIRQSRLLGGAVMACKTHIECAKRLEFLLGEKSFRNAIGRIGTRRMGPKGGSLLLAHMVLKNLFGYSID